MTPAIQTTSAMFLPFPRALVVDDERDFADLVSSILRDVGMQVSVAYDAASALVRVESDDPDVIICDLAMPGMSGSELLERLRKLGFSKPVIFLTGAADAKSAIQAVRESAHDFLMKPMKRDALLNAVHGALRSEYRRVSNEIEKTLLYRTLDALKPEKPGAWRAKILEDARRAIRERRSVREGKL